MSTGASTPHLEYAPRGRRGRGRGRRVLRAALLLIALAGAIAGVRYGPAGARRARLLYAQRECLAYAAPADQVIFDPDSSAEVSLVGDEQRPLTERPNAPACLIDFAARRPLDLPVSPASPHRPARADPPRIPALAFLGERVSPGGTRRLLIVSRECVFSIGEYQSVAPVGWLDAPQPPLVDMAGTFTIGSDGSLPPYRIFAGRPDPTDASHFTIGYTIAGEAGYLDGWLRDDGTIVLSDHNGPATRLLRVRE